MAFVLSRSSRICQYSCMPLCTSSLYKWRSATSRGTINPPLAIYTVSDHRMVDAQGHVLRVSSIFHSFFCSVPTNSASPISTTAVDLEKETKISRDSGSGEAVKSWKSNLFEKFTRGGPRSWMSLLLTMATSIALCTGYKLFKNKRIEEINESNKSGGKIVEEDGKVTIGCPFSLIDHHGKPVTDEDFHGMWKLIYFGFTHCPDICPVEIQKLVAAVDKIKAKGRIEVLPIFISVDPERDSVEQVREYVTEFHPKLIGLTGSPEEVNKVARSYRVYYMKAQQEDDDYLVDHSIITFLMAPDMGFVKFFGKNHTVEDLANGVIGEIKQYNKKK